MTGVGSLYSGYILFLGYGWDTVVRILDPRPWYIRIEKEGGNARIRLVIFDIRVCPLRARSLKPTSV